MNFNVASWSSYAEEYNKNAVFSDNMLHTGLGLSGLHPARILKNSRSVIDVGCGTGINTFLLSKHTYGRVTGIDPVMSQIQQAKQMFQDSHAEYICCEFQELPEYTSCRYDLATFFGSLDYICLDEAFFKILDLITHSGSRCFISKFHPFWTTLYGNDTDKELDVSYFDSGRKDLVHFGKSKFIRYHYTLADFILLFTSHHWMLSEFAEPEPIFEHSAFAYSGYDNDPILKQRLRKIPMTALFEFRKEM